MKDKNKLFYIDPMSYANLGEYDYSLLSNIKNTEITFIGNKKFQYKNTPFNKKLVFNYSDKKGFFKTISYLLSLTKLFFLIISKKPGIIHIQWIKLYSVELFYYKLIKLISPSLKIIFTAHNLLPHNTGDKFKPIFTKFYTLCDEIIVHTVLSKDEMVRIFNIPESKIHVVRHGIFKVNYNKEDLNKQIEHFSNKYDLKSKTIISALGNISKYKGTDLLIDAWKGSNKLHDNYHLIVAGKGNLDEINISEPLPNATIINRFLTDYEFLALIKLTDLLVLPYREISQSGLLLTALGERVPILVSQVGGLTEPFDIAKIGWQLPKGFSPFELANILENIVDNKDTITEIKNNENAWNKIDESYNWVKIGQKTFDIYKILS